MRLRARVLIAGFTLCFGGCAVTLAYDDYGDQKASVGNDAGGDAGCVPETCTGLAANCGEVPDGCGTLLECGTCANGENCGARGPNQCGTGTCTPKTCEELGFSCGDASDGCGKALYCGGCDGFDTCGALKPHECGCKPTTCQAVGAQCGIIDTGCGTTNCGDCVAPMMCGADQAGSGRNFAHQCVCPTCQSAGATCGYLPPCGTDATSAVYCGDCPTGQTCNAQGSGFEKPNTCG